MEQKKFLGVAQQCAENLKVSAGEGNACILIAHDGDQVYYKLFGKRRDVVVCILELLQEDQEIRQLIGGALKILDECDTEALEEE